MGHSLEFSCDVIAPPRASRGVPTSVTCPACLKNADKHKSAGLAGASLLQLAGGAVEDAGTAQLPRTAAVAVQPPVTTSPAAHQKHSPVKSTVSSEVTSRSPAERWSEPGGSRADMCLVGDFRSKSNVDDGCDNRQDRASPAPVARRASYADPSSVPVSARQQSGQGQAATAVPGRRFTLPTPLPSLGSILEGVPGRGHLKRSHEDAGTPPRKDSGSASGSVTSGGISGIGGCEKPESGTGGGANGGGDGSTAGEAGRPGKRPLASAQTGVDSSVHPISAAGAKRLFPGAGAKGFEGWGQRRPNISGTDQVGFLTSSLAPDWRKCGLGAMGRAASFDEARATAGRTLMEPQHDGKIRRASAFVNNASSLTPVRTEVGRRDSAFEQRPTPSAPPLSHYSDLLSAAKSFKSVTACAGAPPRHPFPRRDPNVDVEEGRDPATGGTDAFRRQGSASSSLWRSSKLTKWAVGGGGDGNGNVNGERSGSQALPPAMAAMPARGTRMWHVMSADSRFTAGLAAAPNAKTTASSTLSRFAWPAKTVAQSQQGPAAQAIGGGGRGDAAATSGSAPEDHLAGLAGVVGAGQERHGGAAASQARRWSVLDPSPASTGKESAVLVPAWGAPAAESPSREETSSSAISSGRGKPRRGGIFGNGNVDTDEDMPLRPSQRRGSMAAPNDTEQTRWQSGLNQTSSTSDHAAAAGMPTFAPAWGETMEEGQKGQSPARDDKATVSVAPGGGSAPRRSGLFGGGSCSGATEKVALGRPPPRRGSMVVVSDMGGESQRRRFSVVEQTSPASDQAEGSSATLVEPAWGATMRDAGEAREKLGCQEAPSSANVSAGSGVLSRRGSMFDCGNDTREEISFGPPPPRRGSMLTLNPPPRRGSMVAIDARAWELPSLPAAADTPGQDSSAKATTATTGNLQHSACQSGEKPMGPLTSRRGGILAVGVSPCDWGGKSEEEGRGDTSSSTTSYQASRSRRGSAVMSGKSNGSPSVVGGMGAGAMPPLASPTRSVAEPSQHQPAGVRDEHVATAPAWEEEALERTLPSLDVVAGKAVCGSDGRGDAANAEGDNGDCQDNAELSPTAAWWAPGARPPWPRSGDTGTQETHEQTGREGKGESGGLS